MWLILLGVVLCGGSTYIVSKLVRPVYEASSTVVIDIQSSTSTFDNVSASEQIAPTYAQLITSARVLKPVVAHHPGLTLVQLQGMVTAKFQGNTALIEIAVDNSDPDLAVQLADEVGQSFAHYANTQLPGSVFTLPAERPISPLRPKPSLYAGIGALVGLGLALSLIIIFEWIDDRLKRPEEAEDLLGVETLTVIPRLSSGRRMKLAERVPALQEGMRILCAGLTAAQAIKPFKLVMITSALPGEGKTTIAANLATFLAMSGKRVLLVDADLRHPTLDQHFEHVRLDNRRGLAGILEDERAVYDVALEVQETNTSGLFILTAGIPPLNSTELLQCPSVDRLFVSLKKAPFDSIIFDTSPLLPVADARIVASHVQATMLVVDSSKTPRSALRRARQLLSRTRCMTVGVVLNKSPWLDSSETRQYLRSVRRPRSDFALPELPDTPTLNDEVDSDTPTLNDEVDPDTSTTIRLLSRAKTGTETP